MTMLKFTSILLSILLGTIGSSNAQRSDDSLSEINEDRLQMNRDGMKVLGSWAAGNIILGGIGMTQSEGNAKYFHQMNLAWNSVNLAIAGLGYLGSRKSPSEFTLSDTIREFHKFEKILLFNAGLDVGYMATGAYLWERGIRKENSRLEGYGQSLILQGAFLFTFDLILFLASKNKSSKLLDSIDESLSVTPGGVNLRMTF